MFTHSIYINNAKLSDKSEFFYAVFAIAYKTKQICVRLCINKIHSYICTHSNEEYTDMEEGDRREKGN